MDLWFYTRLDALFANGPLWHALCHRYLALHAGGNHLYVVWFGAHRFAVYRRFVFLEPRRVAPQTNASWARHMCNIARFEPPLSAYRQRSIALLRYAHHDRFSRDVCLARRRARRVVVALGRRCRRFECVALSLGDADRLPRVLFYPRCESQGAEVSFVWFASFCIYCIFHWSRLRSDALADVVIRFKDAPIARRSAGDSHQRCDCRIEQCSPIPRRYARTPFEARRRLDAEFGLDLYRCEVSIL